MYDEYFLPFLSFPFILMAYSEQLLTNSKLIFINFDLCLGGPAKKIRLTPGSQDFSNVFFRF